MILYLIRHGESVYNAEGRIQGHSDIPLSEFGRRQSASLAACLAAVPLEAVFSSPLRRAAETAAPIAAWHGLAVQFDDRLKEIHAGIFQGLLWTEIAERFPREALPWLGQEPDFVIPGGESRRQLMHRGQLGLEAIRQQSYQTVAVVAHGGVLSAALKGLLGIPAQRNPFNLSNASISKLIWKNDVKLMTLNQLDHLRQFDLAREDQTGNL